MKIKEILKITNGKLICGDEDLDIQNFEKDTRIIQKGDMYVAIKGEKFDGNDFYKDAINKGAVACLMSKEPDEKIGSIVLVENTVKAIQQIAAYKRSQVDIPVVAVTGSVGKTSTKDIVAAVMSQKYKVLKTQGNLNNDIGLPFTLLKLHDENAIVVEMGMNHFGEISLLTSIAKPTLAIITNIGTAHIGNLGSRENILKAKLEILEGLQGNSVIINNDNDLLSDWAEKNKEKYNIITYGINNKNSKYVAEDIHSYEDRSEYRIDGKEVVVPVGGEHFVLNSLCAIAVGRYFDIPMAKITEGISGFELTKGRMEIEKAKCGASIINDTYNANYDSMKAAIEYLEKIEGKRKIAVLGDMKELGEYSESLHRKVGEEVKNIDILITIGELAKCIEETADVREMLHFDNNESALEYLKKIMKKDDIILLKASNSMKFGDIAKELILM
ncbi:uDP-N-acetylmuramoyl-tripeptide--D-alanyl-D-alanine ligase [Clostridium sp. CAG:793]|nr:uDP-N-acetylmuramoyl-tripeptide--D-alanyl-D-alanine ligase [Clostridium sp. CAG:793]